MRAPRGERVQAAPGATGQVAVQVIPEGAEPVKGLMCPFSPGSRAFPGTPGTGPGSRVERPTGRTTLGAGPGCGDTWVAGNGYAIVAGPRCSVGVWAGARLRSSLRVPAGCQSAGHGALRVPAAGSIRGAAAPARGAGARPAGDHALPVSGPAHAASGAAAWAARERACPSRIA